jgi:hypothetical protein
VANLVKTTDGVVAFPDHLTDDEIAERVRSAAELAALGVSRSPRAAPVAVVPAVAAPAMKQANPNWRPPPEAAQRTWSEEYNDRLAARQRAAHERVYGRHRR